MMQELFEAEPPPSLPHISALFFQSAQAESGTCLISLIENDVRGGL